MSTVEAAIAAIRQGLCYGWLPRSFISAELEKGSLVVLPLEAGASRNIPLGMTFSASGGNDPAVRVLAGLLSKSGG
jgi:DNA-binding transcriptional LysR family regulator